MKTWIYCFFKDKLYKEVTDALQKSGKEFLSYDELLECKYLSSCINGKKHLTNLIIQLLFI